MNSLRVCLRTYYDFLIGVFVDETKRFELSHLNGHDRTIRADKLRSCDCYVTAARVKNYFSLKFRFCQQALNGAAIFAACFASGRERFSLNLTTNISYNLR